jgi:hypothetical protein
VKLQQAIDRVIEATGDRYRREVLDVIVMSTIGVLGFHVAPDGEICDPRPGHPQREPWVQQKNVRFAGSGSRGRRR